MSWKPGPSTGLDLASQTHKRDFFSCELKVTTIVWLDWNIKKRRRC